MINTLTWECSSCGLQVTYMTEITPPLRVRLSELAALQFTEEEP